jgi:hypothetical protein
MANPKSTASIAGHPLHPMLVEFPIAFFVATFVSDLIFWQSGNSFWAAASFWLLGAGLIMAALAAAAGLVDFLGEPKIRALNDAWWHAGGNVIAVLIQLCNICDTNPAKPPSYRPGCCSRSPWFAFCCLRVGRAGSSSISTASRFRTSAANARSPLAKPRPAADDAV